MPSNLSEPEIFHLRMLAGAGASARDTAIPAAGKGVVLDADIVARLVALKFVAASVQADGSPSTFWLSDAGSAEAKRHA